MSGKALKSFKILKSELSKRFNLIQISATISHRVSCQVSSCFPILCFFPKWFLIFCFSGWADCHFPLPMFQICSIQFRTCTVREKTRGTVTYYSSYYRMFHVFCNLVYFFYGSHANSCWYQSTKSRSLRHFKITVYRGPYKQRTL